MTLYSIHLLLFRGIQKKTHTPALVLFFKPKAINGAKYWLSLSLHLIAFVTESERITELPGVQQRPQEYTQNNINDDDEDVNVKNSNKLREREDE